MTLMNRMAAKTLYTTLDKYEVIKKMVLRAVDPEKPSLVNSHAKNRANLDATFLDLVHHWKDFKRDAKLSDEEFNKLDDDGNPEYQFNDDWMESIEEEYYGVIDKSDAILTSPATDLNFAENGSDKETKQSDLEAKQSVKLSSYLKKQVTLFSEGITSSIDNIANIINKMEDGSENPSKVQMLRLDLQTIDVKIDDKLNLLVLQYCETLSDGDAEGQETLRDEFTKKEKKRLNDLLFLLANKVKDNSVTKGSISSPDASAKKQLFLKKTDPPIWDGNVVNYSEFVRKWKAQVSSAGLTDEQELDRLRDCVPSQASKALFGEDKMVKAWKILDELYGDKDLVANILKNQLKNIKAKSKIPHDMVIEIVTEVKNVVLRFEALEMESMLRVDNEFLSAVYRALPSTCQTKWLEFDKGSYKSKWEAFMKFMDIIREQALQNKVLLSCYEQQPIPASEICKKCNAAHGANRKCLNVGAAAANAVNGKVENGNGDADKKEREKKAKDECGKCPLCKSFHTFNSKKEKMFWPSDRLFRCKDFKNMSSKDRGDTLEKYKACAICTSWNHQKIDCKVAAKCTEVVNGKKCGGSHSSLVCGSGNAYCGSVAPTLISCNSSSSNCQGQPDLCAEALLFFQEVPISGVGEPSLVCWDSGSTRALITHSFAKANNLRSEDVVFRLDVVSQKGTPQQGCYYVFEVRKIDGSTREIWAFGVDSIMEPIDDIDLSSVKHLFPHVPDKAFISLTSKSPDILIGTNFLGLHPSGGEGRDVAGDLRACHSDFGCGWVIAGAHPDLKPFSPKFSSNAFNLARINKCEVVPGSLDKFWEGESLGVHPPKRCGKCLRCPECTDQVLIRSRKDQEELEILKNNVRLVNGQLHCNYPFKRDPSCLPNNRETVLRMAISQEKKLKRSGMLEQYNDQIKKFIDRGIVVKLDKHEMADWKGPINYISHHGVVKEDSVTTPLRVVTNSSLRNGTTSLNGCMFSGPNSLNSMYNIGIRFRCHEVGLTYDLTKAYNSLVTGPVEKHLRRLIWRFDPDEDWTDYAFATMHYGDLPASNLLEIGRNLTAEEGAHIDPEAAQKIINDTYVDDGVSGGPKDVVDRMRGEQLPDGSFSGTLRQIFDKGNLKLKTILVSGETNEEIKNLIGGKILGYNWDATTDIISIPFNIHLCNKKRGVWPQPPLTAETLNLLQTTPLTKKVCLSITNGNFDFLGIACPFTIRFKLLMQEFYQSRSDNSKESWNMLCPAAAVQNWIDLISEAVKTESLCFPRTVRPTNAISNPLIAYFTDGALPAFSSAVYVQWQVKCEHGYDSCDYDYEANLLTAKARVTPVTGLTIPRVEMNGKVLGSRHALSTVKALQTEPLMRPTSVVPMCDSKCTISAVDTSSRALKPFFHNRVSEILDNKKEMEKYCPVEEIHYVDTSLNPADLPTRPGIKLTDIGMDSFWQKGPDFLCSRRELWPITRDFVHAELPVEEVRSSVSVFLTSIRKAVITGSVKGVKLPALCLAVKEASNFYNNLHKVHRILARLIKGWDLKGKGIPLTKEALGEPDAMELSKAERLLLTFSMFETVNADENGKLLSLCPKKDGNIVVTSGRLREESLSKLIGSPYLPILMPETRAAHLYMLEAHEGEDGTVHNSIAETLARSRKKVWIHRGRNLAKKICNECYRCKRENLVLAKQQMGKIKDESSSVSKPFTFVSLDFAGPYKVKGIVNPRTRIKCWIAVYCCRATKAVDLYAVCGYDTQSFLTKHEEFVARRGAPNSVVSDRGTQLVSAGKVLAQKSADSKNTPVGWDWARITSENAASNWIFAPIGSPHYNGLPEATIKVLKKTLNHAIRPGVELSYPELVTLLARIAYTVNDRPLGLAETSASNEQEDFLAPLTPNMMLLGRSSSISPPMTYNANEKFCARLAFVAEVEKDWWRSWVKQVLPTLFSYKKWKKRQANIQVGEIVMLHYPGQLKNDYCIIARVDEVHPSSDNLVRQVSISYRKKNSREPAGVCNKSLITEKVSVHRLHRLDLKIEYYT